MQSGSIDIRSWYSWLMIISFLGYLLISYVLERTEFGLFITAYAFLFLTYLLIFYNSDYWGIREKQILGAAIGIRVLMLFFIPNLSDDIYRFIWDGNLFKMGVNPFSVTIF